MDSFSTEPCSTVGSESDCRSKGRYFDPYPIKYFHTFVEIDHEIISKVILLPTNSRRVVVSEKNVQEVMVNCSGKKVS